MRLQHAFSSIISFLVLWPLAACSMVTYDPDLRDEYVTPDLTSFILGVEPEFKADLLHNRYAIMAEEKEFVLVHLLSNPENDRYSFFVRGPFRQREAVQVYGTIVGFGSIVDTIIYTTEYMPSRVFSQFARRLDSGVVVVFLPAQYRECDIEMRRMFDELFLNENTLSHVGAISLPSGKPVSRDLARQIWLSCIYNCWKRSEFRVNERTGKQTGYTRFLWDGAIGSREPVDVIIPSNVDQIRDFLKTPSSLDSWADQPQEQEHRGPLPSDIPSDTTAPSQPPDPTQ